MRVPEGKVEEEYEKELDIDELAKDREEDQKGDQATAQYYQCGTCRKRFNSAKALAGHMRVHVQSTKLDHVQNPPRGNKRIMPKKKINDQHHQYKLTTSKKKNNILKKSSAMEVTAAASATKSNLDHLIRNGKFTTCSLCHKTFPSFKSLYGHMRCHPGRGWRGMKPPPPPAPAPFCDNSIIPSAPTGIDQSVKKGSRPVSDDHDLIIMLQSTAADPNSFPAVTARAPRSCCNINVDRSSASAISAPSQEKTEADYQIDEADATCGLLMLASGARVHRSHHLIMSTHGSPNLQEDHLRHCNIYSFEVRDGDGEYHIGNEDGRDEIGDQYIGNEERFCDYLVTSKNKKKKKKKKKAMDDHQKQKPMVDIIHGKECNLVSSWRQVVEGINNCSWGAEKTSCSFRENSGGVLEKSAAAARGRGDLQTSKKRKLQANEELEVEYYDSTTTVADHADQDPKTKKKKKKKRRVMEQQLRDQQLVLDHDSQSHDHHVLQMDQAGILGDEYQYRHQKNIASSSSTDHQNNAIISTDHDLEEKEKEKEKEKKQQHRCCRDICNIKLGELGHKSSHSCKPNKNCVIPAAACSTSCFLQLQVVEGINDHGVAAFAAEEEESDQHDGIVDAAAAACRLPPITAAEKELHRCRICNKSFPSGQALGGHMRRHQRGRPTSHARDRSSLSSAADTTTVSGGDIGAAGTNIAAAANVATASSGEIGSCSNQQTGGGDGTAAGSTRIGRFDLNELPAAAVEEEEVVHNSS
ncbi:hypothetical protein Dimus_014417 [Dionaea muscipula]